ncbi:ligand-binding sensor domain-containing diguanylate cyclase [Inhella gelatinilytica]|uniref:diguanylate cyclase n=1 Tax=Inhella gelatinilytica TaxID=2795030 RepID=A0A931IUL5_9BURK|nr:ligand-binding sensor domain-containing diguanylate cyclase [Inhella gelatinilytica]MBH9552237.1 diguanylate cyclase [Inhella gelatinilytica]
MLRCAAGWAVRLGLWGGLLWGLLVGGLARAEFERPALAEPLFESVAESTQLGHVVVSALATDHRGFLWIASAAGVARFDGHELQSLKLPIDPQAGSRQFVRSLLWSRAGQLWVGTDHQGLFAYDPLTERWTVYAPAPAGSFVRGSIRGLAEDAQGRIWVATLGNGVQRLDPQTGQLEAYGVRQGLRDERVQSLFFDRNQGVWAGTWSGLDYLGPGQPRFAPAPGPLSLPGETVTSLFEDPLGRLWIGTRAGALLRWTPEGAKLDWLDRGESPLGAPAAFAVMDAGEIWVARGQGVDIRQLGSGRRLQALRPRAIRPYGLAGNDVRAMLRDAAGVLWVGSFGGGLQRHLPNHLAYWVRQADEKELSVLGRVDVRSLLQLPNGEIWVGTAERGIAVLDSELRVLRTQNLPERIERDVVALALGPDHRVWVGIEGRIFVWAQGRWQHVYSLGNVWVRRLLIQADGTALAATHDGVYRLRPGAKAFERLTLRGGKPLSGTVNAVVQALDGRIWLGGQQGLHTLAPGSSELQAVAGGDKLRQDVLGLLFDASQQLWVDLPAGLHRLHGWTGERAELLPVEAANSADGGSFGANLLADASGRIWTQSGVYDPAINRFEPLRDAEGAAHGNAWFRSYVQLKDGRLLFGGSRGLLVVDPTRYRRWQFQPAVQPSRLRIRGQDVPLARLQTKLVLEPDETSFVLDFVAMDLSHPRRNRYRHRLLGVDKDWVESDATARQAAYGGLAPGRYRLEVQGSNRVGDWSPNELKLDIVVRPAWWQTWWARLGGGVLVLGGLLLVVQLRTRWLRRRQAELEFRVQERTQALRELSDALQEKTRALENSAQTDPLTGLHNRRFVTERLDDDLHLVVRQYEEAQRQGQQPRDADLLFFLIDVDHFKQVNDQHGHAAGDSVLKQMRERLQEVFRESDYLVRWGGEEFLVVARASHRRSASLLAERARRAVADRPFELPQGRTLVRTCSIGFACFPLLPDQPRATGWNLLVDLADAALYQAKRGGRNQWAGVVDAGAWSASALAELHLSAETLPDGLTVVSGPQPES